MRPLVAALALAARLAAQTISTEPLISGISGPTDIENAGDGSGRLFLVQQNGVIRIFRNGALTPQPFLDIRAKTRVDAERGLLGLAFPPGYAGKQRFYVDYTDVNGDTVIAQYRVTANRDVADASSEIVLLHITQPFANHNGGQVRFGPDGYLYIAMGDGGSAGDPFNNGQRLDTLLGKLLRMDVESEPEKVHIPPDNPFLQKPGARPEIWAYGLRNPWRFSFDSATGNLWIADVGQDSYEEIDFQAAGDPGGENYGWNLMEGAHCYRENCPADGLTLPVAEYTHDDGCAVIGGFVYRGRVSPGLRNLYLFGDLCSGTIWSVEHQGQQWATHVVLASGFSITTFGEDEAGEIYVANGSNGTIYHILGSAAPRIEPDGVRNAATLAPGLVAGSIATAFVSGVLDDAGIVTGPAGLSVTVNGIAAPVLAVANVHGQEQVNFLVPFEIAGTSSATVVVTRAGRSSVPAEAQVFAVQPGIYGIAHAADYTPVTSGRPLQRGEFGIVYASGLGAVSNQPATGGPGPSSPPAATLADVHVSLAGLPCEVTFAGLAPGMIGVYQVNFRVPAGAPSGSQSVVLGAGQSASPAVAASVQ